MEAGVIILSGGKSSRMGINKALLKINEKPNIERIVGQLRPIFNDITLVTNDTEIYEFLSVKLVQDIFREKGPLAGLHAGLTASLFDRNILVACDMPFASAPLATQLINYMGDYDAVIPVIEGKEHPLFAVYRKTCIGRIEENIKNNHLRMKDLIEQIHVRYVTEKDLPEYSSDSLNRIFFNMNRPNEYEDAKKWAEVEHQEGK